MPYTKSIDEQALLEMENFEQNEKMFLLPCLASQIRKRSLLWKMLKTNLKQKLSSPNLYKKKLQIFDMTLKIDKTLLTSHFLMLFLDHILNDTKKKSY